MLYDVSSTWMEGRCCPLARHGYARDGKRGKAQIVFGLLCNAEGCPVAVEVFAGDTADPATLGAQIDKLRTRFGSPGWSWWATAACSPARASARRWSRPGSTGSAPCARRRSGNWLRAGRCKPSLFDQRDLAEIHHPDFPGERLIACRNPLLAERRARKREALLRATERDLGTVLAATRRQTRPLKGRDKIGLRIGRVIARHKMAKHIDLEIADDGFTFRRNQRRIAEEAALDGIYVIRTSLPETDLGAHDTVRAYKSLSRVERAFRSFKTVDLKVRPVYHYRPERVRAHVFLCMLAYHVEWHMRRTLAPLLFDDEDPPGAEAARPSVVRPATPSPAARRKAATKRTLQGAPCTASRPCSTIWRPSPRTASNPN